MAKKNALEILKSIGLSFRRHWGLKLISLGFAVILWNYVIVEINPIRTITVDSIKVTFDDNSIIRLKNSGFTVSGALPDKKVNVSVDLPRNETLGRDDVKAVVDLSGITSEGPVKVKVSGRSSKGSVISTSPDTIIVKIDKLAKRVVPVEWSREGTLPEGYWRDEPSIKPSELTIIGPSTLVTRVDRARILISLDGLTQKLSATRSFTLLDIEGNEIDQAGLELSAPNCIVNLQVYPTKTVKINAGISLNGDVARGYEIKDIKIFPGNEIVIAGPKDVLDTITELSPTKPIDISGKNQNVSEPILLEMPKDVHALAGNTITVLVEIGPKMVKETLQNVPITVTGLGAGLKVDTKQLHATVTVTYPELNAKLIKVSRIHLYVDAAGLDARTHTLKITAEADAETGITDIIVVPPEILVTITSTAATP